MQIIVIPAMLVAIVLVAGIFAFIPVQDASTVHSTVGGTVRAIDSTPANFDIDDAGTITLDTNKPIILQSLICEFDDGDTPGSIDFDEPTTLDSQPLEPTLEADLIEDDIIDDGGTSLGNLNIAFEDVLIITVGVDEDDANEVLDCTAIIEGTTDTQVTLQLAD